MKNWGSKCQKNWDRLTQLFSVCPFRGQFSAVILTEAKMASKPQQVRVLTLELNKDGSSIVYKLQKDWILQFRLGSSLLGQTVDLYTNYPLKNSFERNQYSKVEWSSDSNNKGDDTSIFANIFVKTSGSFHFYIKNTRWGFIFTENFTFLEFWVKPRLSWKCICHWIKT